MKKSLLSRFALVCAVLSVAAFGTLSTHAAFAATTSTTHHAKKHTVKKSHKKTAKKAKAKTTFLKAPPATMTGHSRPILGTPDPNVDEPSEMITEIKNRAQDQFWAGKRPYPQQKQDYLNPPPPAPILTGAIAQNELQKRDGNNVTGMRSETLRRVSYSDLSGVTFADQPLRMNASEAFRRSLDTVSFELGRPCKSQEYFGWPMQQSEQGRVDRIFEETNAKFKLRGYNLQPRKPRSVGSDVAAFTADRHDKRILGIWSAGDVGLLLLMCDSDVPPPSAVAAKTKHEPVAKKKSKKTKKRSAKTVTSTSVTPTETGVTQPDAPTGMIDPNMGAGPSGAPVPSAKPQVIPGAASKSAQEEPAQSTPAAPPAATPPAPAPVAPAPVATPEPATPAPAPAPTPTPTPAAAPEPAAPAPAPKVEAPAPVNPTNAFIPADAPPAPAPAAKSAEPIAPDVKR